MSVNTQTVFPERARTQTGRWKRFLREPLLHFLLLGGVIFAATQWYESAAHRHEIVIDEDVRGRLAQTFEQQFSREPSAADMQRLIDQYLREEIMVREAVALGLERDDEIIRRRLLQKYEFLQQDLAAIDEPNQRQLQRYYEQHLARYELPTRVTFTHIYFSPDAGEAAAKARALQALAVLESKSPVRRAPDLGDRFPDLYDYASLGTRQLQRLFGPSELTASIVQAPTEQWSGPYRSGFGWHLVYVSNREAARVPKLDEIRDRVRSDYLQDAHARQNEAAFAQVAAKYTIRRAP